MLNYRTPGVYKEEVLPAPAARLPTGVPVFLGLTEKTPAGSDRLESLALNRWPQFEQKFGKLLTHGYLAHAVRGFFQNGGELCYVVPLEDHTPETIRDRLTRLEYTDSIDLVCAPDIMSDPTSVVQRQQTVLDHCQKTGDRFAILDSLPAIRSNEVPLQRQALRGDNGALYYPWIKVAEGLIPPCGHVAGIYARSDRRVGVHKAPANELLEGVLDLEASLADTEQGELNPLGVNCLRAFPGRGIRVWGARTLSDDPAWTYINVRRLFLTVGRWIEHNLADAVFEPNDSRLWARIGRELTAYFDNLLRRGALRGSAPTEAFYVKCDAETNPAEVRDAGRVVTEIGLAPNLPSEFVVVRIIHDASGTTITGPTGSA